MVVGSHGMKLMKQDPWESKSTINSIVFSKMQVPFF